MIRYLIMSFEILILSSIFTLILIFSLIKYSLLIMNLSLFHFMLLTIKTFSSCLKISPINCQVYSVLRSLCPLISCTFTMISPSVFSLTHFISLFAQILTGIMLLLHLYHFYQLLVFSLNKRQKLFNPSLYVNPSIKEVIDRHCTYFIVFVFLSYHFCLIMVFLEEALYLLFDTVISSKYFIF